MRRPSRGDVWMVDLNPVVGREQAGTRPAVVLSVDELNQSAADLVMVLPLTSREKRVRSHVEVREREAGLAVRSFVKCEDIRSISTRRLERRLGSISADTLVSIEDRLRILLGL
ncbi:MAG TPA: type II toxin-antitoxin system PemK/MazF family toxin [Vicinamibacteria bacterium]|nr:type II toxin-antitoxin system PemK/MazF family toxin [Vicinamibacteria bacterium]